MQEDLLGAWQQYGEVTGMPAERMAATIAQLLAQPMSTEEDYMRFLREAGFQRSTRFFSVLGGGITAWIARVSPVPLTVPLTVCVHTMFL